MVHAAPCPGGMGDLAIVDRGRPSGAFWAYVLRSAWTATYEVYRAR